MALRIASLLPSATEIVAALGAVNELVARSHECDYPPYVDCLPAVTSARLDSSGSSADIHGRMEAALTDALSVYRVDETTLRRLKPEVIVTQAQCEVCAVSEDDVRSLIADWGADGRVPELVSLTAEDLKGVYADIERVARAIGRTAQADGLVQEMRERIAEIEHVAAGLNVRPRVVLIEWMAPLMAGGNWMPELVALAGGENLFGVAGKHSPWIEWDALVDADPDAIVIAPCGFDMERSFADLPALTGDGRWRNLKAVREGRVAVADGNAFFNRPGPRMVETLEILVDILHPDSFDFGHEGTAFRRLAPGT